MWRTNCSMPRPYPWAEKTREGLSKVLRVAVNDGARGHEDGRTRQTRSPGCGVDLRVVKHEVGGPVFDAVAAVSLLRHHGIARHSEPMDLSGV